MIVSEPVKFVITLYRLLASPLYTSSDPAGADLSFMPSSQLQFHMSM